MAKYIWVNITSGNGLLPNAPSHDLKQCWLIIKCIMWHSHERNFTRNVHVPRSSEIILSKLSPHISGDTELKRMNGISHFNNKAVTLIKMIIYDMPRPISAPGSTHFSPSSTIWAPPRHPDLMAVLQTYCIRCKRGDHHAQSAQDVTNAITSRPAT